MEIDRNSSIKVRSAYDELAVDPSNTFQTQPIVDISVIEKDLPRERYNCDERSIRGRLVRLTNPIGHFDIVEPLGGCRGNLSLPSQTGRAYRPAFVNKHTVDPDHAVTKEELEAWRYNYTSVRDLGCQVVTNAGFFDVKTHACFGNIVTNGDVVQTTQKHNANFGIRNGKFVVGYINDTEILDKLNPFDTIVSGLIWLVRQGKPYVHDSITEDLEDMSAQSTGNSFVSVLSARTALGHDKDGRLLILQIEGETWRRGMNLYEFADLAVELGFYSAINLDGGGSATMTQNHTLISEPSWKCRDGGEADPTADGVFRCEKRVSTITCIHAMPPPSSAGIDLDVTSDKNTLKEKFNSGTNAWQTSNRENNISNISIISNISSVSNTTISFSATLQPAMQQKIKRDKRESSPVLKIPFDTTKNTFLLAPHGHYSDARVRSPHALLVARGSAYALALLLILSVAINLYLLRVQARRCNHQSRSNKKGSRDRNRRNNSINSRTNNRITGGSPRMSRSRCTTSTTSSKSNSTAQSSLPNQIHSSARLSIKTATSQWEDDDGTVGFEYVDLQAIVDDDEGDEDNEWSALTRPSAQTMSASSEVEQTYDDDEEDGWSIEQALEERAYANASCAICVLVAGMLLVVVGAALVSLVDFAPCAAGPTGAIGCFAPMDGVGIAGNR